MTREELVEAVAAFLCTQNTGMDHEWWGVGTHPEAEEEKEDWREDARAVISLVGEACAEQCDYQDAVDKIKKLTQDPMDELQRLGQEFDNARALNTEAEDAAEEAETRWMEREARNAS